MVSSGHEAATGTIVTGASKELTPTPVSQEVWKTNGHPVLRYKCFAGCRAMTLRPLVLLLICEFSLKVLNPNFQLGRYYFFIF